MIRHKAFAEGVASDEEVGWAGQERAQSYKEVEGKREMRVDCK